MIKMDEYKIVPSQKENNKINVRGWLLNDGRKYTRKYILLVRVVRREN